MISRKETRMNRIEAVEAIVESFKRRGYTLSDSGERRDIELRRSVGSDDTIAEVQSRAYFRLPQAEAPR